MRGARTTAVKPVLIVIAGPNGAGKTTVTSRIRRDHWSDGVTYLNPDEVAQDKFGDWNNPAHSVKAAHWVAEERERLLAQRESLAFETVLSMPDKLDFIVRARDAGFFVRGFFVSTSDPTINAARVARRVMEGGHTVPIEKIVSRYARSMGHLVRIGLSLRKASPKLCVSISASGHPALLALHHAWKGCAS